MTTETTSVLNSIMVTVDLHVIVTTSVSNDNIGVYSSYQALNSKSFTVVDVFEIPTTSRSLDSETNGEISSNVPVLIIISTWCFGIMVFIACNIIVYIIIAKLCYAKGRRSNSCNLTNQRQSSEMVLRSFGQANESPIYEELDTGNISGAEHKTYNETDEETTSFGNLYDEPANYHDHTKKDESDLNILTFDSLETSCEDDHVYIMTNPLVVNTD